MLIIDNDFKSEVSIKGSLKTFIAETIGTGAVLASVTKMATVGIAASILEDTAGDVVYNPKDSAIGLRQRKGE